MSSDWREIPWLNRALTELGRALCCHSDEGTSPLVKTGAGIYLDPGFRRGDDVFNGPMTQFLNGSILNGLGHVVPFGETFSPSTTIRLRPFVFAR